MADAGRILIIPKGDYDANSTYDKLDLVKYKGTSWLAKKATAGIEPSEANAEWWQNMFDINIADNLTTTAEGLALDARQGKILDDKIATINGDLDVFKLVQKGSSPATGTTIIFDSETPRIYLFVAMRGFDGAGCMYLMRSAGLNIFLAPIKENTELCTLTKEGLTVTINLKIGYTAYSIFRLH